MSKMLIMIILHLLRTYPYRIRIIYSEPNTWSPSEEEYLSKKPQLEQGSLLSLSSIGIYNFVRTPGLSSIAMQDSPSLLVAFASSNGLLVNALANELNPSLTCFINAKNYREPWREHAAMDIQKTLIDGFPLYTNDIYCFELLDYQSVFEALAAVYRENCYRRRIIVSPTGGKMHTIACALIKNCCPDIHIEYPTPESYIEGQKKAAIADIALRSNNVGVEGMLRHLEPWLLNLIGMILYGAAAVRLDWRILLVLLAMTGANYLIAYWAWCFNIRTRAVADTYLQGQRYLRREGEQPANGKDIRLYRMETWLMAAHNSYVMSRDKWRRQIFGRRALRSVSGSVFLVARDALAYAMLVGSFLAGSIDAAGFTLTIGIISTFTNWLNEFVATSDDWRYETLEVDDLRDFLEQKDVLNHGPGPAVSRVKCPPQVELRDVTFTYPRQKRLIIDHLSLTIHPGEKIALVGLNGAGKTTLVKLLSGLYKPDSGEILVDGVPTTSFNAVEYLRLVGTLYQDVNILPFTIGENVSGREDYDQEKVWACLEQAGLKDTVEALPKGLDISITQQLERDGIDLSGGQQQRLLFARALYKDAPLLILDEPTSALDPLAEADLYHKYAQTTGGKTSIFIS